MWTTLPSRWSALYRREAYAGVDPRLARASGQHRTEALGRERYGATSAGASVSSSEAAR